MTDEDIERDLGLAVSLLEESVGCVVGCGCWQDQSPPWDAPEDLDHAITTLDAAAVRAALSRLVMLSDSDAARWAPRLGQTLDACRAYPPTDPRTFFAAAARHLAR